MEWTKNCFYNAEALVFAGCRFVNLLLFVCAFRAVAYRQVFAKSAGAAAVCGEVAPIMDVDGMGVLASVGAI